jgi:hypothetical protein
MPKICSLASKVVGIAEECTKNMPMKQKRHFLADAKNTYFS